MKALKQHVKSNYLERRQFENDCDAETILKEIQSQETADGGFQESRILCYRNESTC